MKEERMKILNMLEKGIINAEEAQSLILALGVSDKKSRKSKEEIGADLNEALNKAGESVGMIAKFVGDKTEQVVEEARPILKKVVDTVADKANCAADDIKNFADKKRNKTDNSCSTDDFEYVQEEECGCGCKTEAEKGGQVKEDDFVNDGSVIIPASEAFTDKKEDAPKEDEK